MNQPPQKESIDSQLQENNTPTKFELPTELHPTVELPPVLQEFEALQCRLAQIEQRRYEAAKKIDQEKDALIAAHANIGVDTDPDSATIHNLEAMREQLRIEKENLQSIYKEASDKVIDEMKEDDIEKRRRYEEERGKIFSPEEIRELERLIDEIYSQNPKWHGTGRLSYPFKGDSKYHGVDYSGEPVDILASILKSGIQPSYDPWAEHVTRQEGLTHTISMTDRHALARIVSQYRLPEGENLQYEFGSARWWWAILSAKEKMEYLLTNPATGIQAKTWIGACSSQTINTDPKKYFETMSNARSTLSDNYPVIIGIRKTEVSASAMHDIGGISEDYETRSTTAVGLNAFTHIEVPLKNIKETKSILQALGVELPVIPIEEGELWLSRKYR